MNQDNGCKPCAILRKEYEKHEEEYLKNVKKCCLDAYCGPETAAFKVWVDKMNECCSVTINEIGTYRVKRKENMCTPCRLYLPKKSED